MQYLKYLILGIYKTDNLLKQQNRSSFLLALRRKSKDSIAGKATKTTTKLKNVTNAAC